MKKNNQNRISIVAILFVFCMSGFTPLAHAMTPPIQTSYVMVTNVTQNSAQVQTVFGSNYEQYQSSPSHFEYYPENLCATGANCVTGFIVSKTEPNANHSAVLLNLRPNTNYSVRSIFHLQPYCVTTPCNTIFVPGPATTFSTKEVSSVEDDLFQTTLYYGMKGDSDVALLQAILKELGFYSGSVTGNFGARTWVAVRSYQTSVGLPRSGRVGPLTEKALVRSITTLPDSVSTELFRSAR